MSLIPPCAFSDPTEQFLADRFGLSPSDAKTTAGIAAGKDLKRIARDRELSVHTVKGQIARIFLKTGTNTQQALAVAAWRCWAANSGASINKSLVE